MLVQIVRYLQGYIKIIVLGYSTERFLNLCKNKDIDIWGLHSTNNGYEMYIKVGDFRKIKPFVKKTTSKIKIISRYGLPFHLFEFRKRNLFFFGIFWYTERDVISLKGGMQP